MFIQTEETPNPETMKFLPDSPVLEKGAAEFRSVTDAYPSPLAKQLFGISGVRSVFLGVGFISVTKETEQDWKLLKPKIMATIMDHYMSGLPVMDAPVSADNIAEENDDELVVQIKELLDTRVRPAVAQDGGDIVFDRFDNGVVYLQMRGACAGCPSSTATLKMGIENMLKHFVPEVNEVRASAL